MKRKSAQRPAGPRPGKATGQFYARALAIELEASARYRALAGQMRASDNPRTAELFLKLARHEQQHADRLKGLAGEAALSPRAREQFLKGAAGRTEVPNYEFLYRRVPPQHALLMALESERRAKTYFRRIRATTTDARIKKLAAEFAREEARHVRWLEKALASEPEDPSYQHPEVP
jgi:rubrerythrin